jgi:hypothetical protein
LRRLQNSTHSHATEQVHQIRCCVYPYILYTVYSSAAYARKDPTACHWHVDFRVAVGRWTADWATIWCPPSLSLGLSGSVFPLPLTLCNGNRTHTTQPVRATSADRQGRRGPHPLSDLTLGPEACSVTAYWHQHVTVTGRVFVFMTDRVKCNLDRHVQSNPS